ncbi:tetratricopeptide repeat protein, partial [Candidatus Dependentiae bacterium]
MAYWLYEYMKALERKIINYPNDLNSLIELGYLYMDHFHDGKKSLDYLQRALDLDPEDSEALFWMAKTYCHEFCDDEKAKQALCEAIKIDPSRADCHDFLASFLIWDDDEKSLYHLKKTIELEPSWIYPRTRLFGRFMGENNFSEAEKIAIETLEIFNNLKIPRPKTPREEYYEECVTGRVEKSKAMIEGLFKEIKKSRLKLNRFKEGIKRVEVLNKKLKENPEEEKLVIEKSFVCAYHIDQFEEAVKVLEEALKTDPDNTNFFYWLSWFYLEKDKNDEAQKLLSRALKIYPDKADFHFLLAKSHLKFICKKLEVIGCFIEKNDFNVSIKHLNNAIKIQPEWLLPRFLLIKCILHHSAFKEAFKEISLLEKLVKNLRKPKVKDFGEEHFEKFITGRTIEDFELKKEVSNFGHVINNCR